MVLKDFNAGRAYLEQVKSKAKLWQAGMDRVTENAAEFSRQLNQLSALAEEVYESIVQITCLQLFTRIAERNPIDTGRSRASWGISFSNDGDKQPKDFSGGESAADSIIKSKAEQFSYHIEQDRVVIYNNVEYIEHLEDGSSRQAPAGMVAVSLAEFNQNLAENIAALGL